MLVVGSIWRTLPRQLIFVDVVGRPYVFVVVCHLVGWRFAESHVAGYFVQAFAALFAVDHAAHLVAQFGHELVSVVRDVLQVARIATISQIDGKAACLFGKVPASAMQIHPTAGSRVRRVRRVRRRLARSDSCGSESLAAHKQTVSGRVNNRALAPAPDRKRRTTWAEFIRIYLAVLAGTDISAAEVLMRGLVTCYVLFLYIRRALEIGRAHV